MNLEYLIQFVKENSLIESSSDIDFLFPDSPEVEGNKSIDLQIEKVLKWGYENDKLEDFYSEHLDLLIDSGVIEPLIGCKIISTSSIQTSTTFELFQFESQNVLYYKVIGDGEYSDCWDTEGFFKVIEKTSKLDIIDLFKSKCQEVFTMNGEFDYDELLSEGNSIEFYS
jgi:hypothetical protein